MRSWVGTPVPRHEDLHLLTGQGVFVDDVHLPGMLHLHFLRSPHAHARVVRIDLRRAQALPGVVRVLTFADLGPAARPLPVQIPLGEIFAPVTQTPLANRYVRFVGEPVAAVVAEDRYVAEDAAELIEVEYEPLPAVTDPIAALEENSPLVYPGTDQTHPVVPRNLAGRWQQRCGVPEDALARADHRLELTLSIARGTAQPIEPRGAVAQWELGAGLTFWGSIQTPHRHKSHLAYMLGIPEHKVRVVTANVGGGFGVKGPLYPEEVVTAAAAMLTRRPVKWIEDRREHCLAAIQDREQVHRVQVAFTPDGRILSLIDRFVYDTGAYIPYGLLIGVITTSSLIGPYKIPNVHLEFEAVLTNKPPVAAYRGAGRPQGVFIIERVLDAIADELGLDPLVVRERNLIPPQDFPYKTGLMAQDNLPQEYDSANFPDMIRMLKEAVDFDAFRREQAAVRREGRYLGVGVACYIEGCGVGPFEGATVTVDSRGRVTVATGAASQGQGHATTLAQLVAQELGLSPGDIEVVGGDTAAIEHGLGTYASRVAVTAGNAAALAARRVREKALALAAQKLEVALEDLDLVEGNVIVRGAPTRSISLGELARFATPGRGVLPFPGAPGLGAIEYFEPGKSTSATGVHACFIEVDPQECIPRIRRYVVIHDCGVIINPVIVEGQVHGGVAQGVGGALYEKIVYSDDGQLLTGTLMDYLLPTAKEVPPLEVHHLETPSPFNPLGVKGAGEGGTLPVYAAVARALEDALSPFGIRIRNMPVLPIDLYQMIHGKT